ncbi:DUF4258 domain-containing protein [Paracoccus yeei]|nr:DUF4258 domain-containing protein [Paracoccus yeei]
MTNVARFPTPMFATRFEEIVKDRSRFSHEVVMTDHIRVRMEERNITIRQVINVLRKGAVVSEPSWNPTYRSYEAKMAYSGAGMHIEVVCAIEEGSVQVVAITTY